MSHSEDKYLADFHRFIRDNKKAFNAVMPIDVDTLSDEDIRILSNFATYRAGKQHYEDMGGKVDKSVIDGIRVFFATPELDAKKTIRKAFTWYEKGAMNKTSLKAAMFDQPAFSPRVERYLSQKRHENYRNAFTDMRRSIVKLSQSIRDVQDLLKNNQEPLSSPAMALKMRKHLRSINGALNRCDQCGRAGIAWAHRSGIPLDKATKAIQQMYVSKLPALESALRPAESMLHSQGMNSTVCNQINRRQFLWRHDIRDVRQEERRLNYAKQDTSYAAG